MSSDDIWGVIPFPPGDNDTDTAFGGSHFNLTALEELEYHLFENRTISNDSRCFLAFEPYTPKYMFPNGTWLNYKSCYSSIHPIGARAKTGLGIGAMYALALFFIILNLRKHGPLYLPKEKRFFPISRRWQWYWGSIVCAFALISLFTNIDVDRYYVMEIPIILTCFFWFLMQQGALALVWEAVRHWGSWNERQVVDPEPFAVRQEGRRYNFELLIPIWFYLWVWLNFFLIIPRNWAKIQMQRSPETTLLIAKPSATEGRFKAAPFCLLVAWLTIIVSLAHSIKHYKKRRVGLVDSVVDAFRAIPLRFLLIIPLALVMIAYQALAAFQWDYSPLNVEGHVAAIYVGGYVPILLILIVQIVHGYVAPNEDKELIRQRRVRGVELDRDLGIVQKPAWWRRAKHGNGPTSMRDIIRRNVNEVTGRKRQSQQGAGNSPPGENANGDVELVERRSEPAPSRLPPTGVSRYGGRSERRRAERTMQSAASLLFPASGEVQEREEIQAQQPIEEPPPSYNESTGRLAAPREIRGSDSTAATVSDRGPQQIRSMLDV